jgi:hypothetical protein
MRAVTLEALTEQLELGEHLLALRGKMFAPQDLPGRYGRVVRAIDHLLEVLNATAVVAGGWAVWRHGFLGRITQDIDIVLASDQIDQFLRAASVSGFEVLAEAAGRWPKLLHKETGIKVDILPEGGRPGSAAKPAPAAIPHPSVLGAFGTSLQYISLPALIELKLGAGRGRDESDVIELMRVHLDEAEAIRGHLAAVHPDYVVAFDRLLQRAREQRDE